MEAERLQYLKLDLRQHTFDLVVCILLVVLGGEDQALLAAEGEAGGDPAGGTGGALQEQRHQ